MTAQAEMFPRVDPYVATRVAVLDDQDAGVETMLAAALQLVGSVTGPAGDPHLMGYRSLTIARELAAVLNHHGWRLTRITEQGETP